MKQSVSFVALLAGGIASLLSSGCPKKDGCTTDTDCKGARVCVSGTCADPKAASTAGGTPPAVMPSPVATLTPPEEVRGTTDPAGPADPGAAGGLVVNPPSTFARAVVRAAPSLTAANVTSLDRGTPVTSLEMSSDGQFHKVRWTVNGGGEGWLHRDVVSAPGAAPKAARGSCQREGQFCLLNGTTAGVCMNVGSLACATPTEITHHDGCKMRSQACSCPGAKGTCDLGPAKEGLYCQCKAAAAKGITPVSDPPCGCKRDGVIFEKNGSVYGCEGGGNWCASSPRLPGGCPKRPGC